MNDHLDGLLSQYERGYLTRRQFIAATSALLAVPTLAASAPIGTVQQLNHVTVFVKDVQKSVRFYQELLGMPVLTNQSPGVNLNAGAGFLGIYPAGQSATSGSINHFCLGMKNFDADAVLKQLTDRGLQANIRLRGNTKELYFNDPDNLRVQLQDAKYKGGVGVLGDQDPK